MAEESRCNFAATASRLDCHCAVKGAVRGAADGCAVGWVLEHLKS
jgi:hypothetical protein